MYVSTLMRLGRRRNCHLRRIEALVFFGLGFDFSTFSEKRREFGLYIPPIIISCLILHDLIDPIYPISFPIKLALSFDISLHMLLILHHLHSSFPLTPLLLYLPLIRMFYHTAPLMLSRLPFAIRSNSLFISFGSNIATTPIALFCF